MPAGGITAHERPSFVICLWGPDERLKLDAARSICFDLGRRLIAIDGPTLWRGDRALASQRLERSFREARLAAWEETLAAPAALFIAGFDAAQATDPGARAALITLAAASEHGLIFLSTAAPWGQIPAAAHEGESQSVERSTPVHAAEDVPVLSLGLPAPDHPLRVAAWERSLPAIADEDAKALAARFRLTAAQIAAAARDAVGYARLRGDRAPSLDDLAAGARAQSNQALGRLAHKVETRQTWDDLILSPSPMAQLRSIAAYVRHRHVVYERWGFAGRMALGSGVTALFAGPSGTGKTMAAGIIAHDLGLDIYRIDLSSVVSKYIGETEKNLSQLFHEAASANAILFFDEADALFGKRSEVRDAHDRYANIEVAYLLQQMEEFDGLAILATNLRDHIDAAFARRLQFAIAFPLPEAAERERIWRRHIPESAPLAPDVDLAFLAGLPLSGGNIRNCVLAAAFMAADSSGRIEMAHMAQAVARELEKSGRPVLQSDFGPYYRLLSLR